MDIAPTDPTGGHADANLPGARLGHFNFRKGEFPRGREQQRFHGGSLMGRGGRTARPSKKGLIRSAARGARPMPRAPREFLRCLPSEKKASPAISPDSTSNSPHHSTQSSQAWLLPGRRPVGSWNVGNRARTLVDPLTKGGWRGQGRCPSTWRTTGETGSRQENRVKSPFSRARRRGYVDTALAHPYILLFDPTATPVAFNGHWRLSQRVPPTHVHPEGSHRFHRLPGAQCPLEEAWSGR